jgi:hypothetical protein
MNNCFITIAEITFLPPRPIPFCYLHGLDLVSAHSLSLLKAQKYMSVGAHESLKPWGSVDSILHLVVQQKMFVGPKFGNRNS